MSAINEETSFMNSAIVARRRNVVVTMQAMETDEDHGSATFLRMSVVHHENQCMGKHARYTRLGAKKTRWVTRL